MSAHGPLDGSTDIGIIEYWKNCTKAIREIRRGRQVMFFGDPNAILGESYESVVGSVVAGKQSAASKAFC